MNYLSFVFSTTNNEQLSTDTTKPLRLILFIVYAAKLMPNILIAYLSREGRFIYLLLLRK